MSNSFFEHTGFIAAQNMHFIEGLYAEYKNSPSSVEEGWRKFFEILDFDNQSSSTDSIQEDLNAKVNNLIYAYRFIGHLSAKLDPLDLEKSPDISLSIEDFGISKSDIHKTTALGGVYKDLSLMQIKDKLELMYCSNISCEFMHIQDASERNWLIELYEQKVSGKNFAVHEKKDILKYIASVEEMEQYLHTKFPGAKRFSINGLENSITAIQYLINEACKHNYEEAVIAMAHRGRLAALTEVLQKPYEILLKEFMGKIDINHKEGFAGDVKYHLGYKNDIQASDGKKITLEMLSNPSHLESINSVLQGKVRKSLDNGTKSFAILTHGDSAFAGQGVVYESITMSYLDAYSTKGVIHIVMDNKVGFTGETYDTRIGRYSTGLGKAHEMPIIHINADDAESVVLASAIALEYKEKFNKDFIINIIGYRKYGHNEGDEPLYTQPLMYKLIKNKLSPAHIYNQKLVSENIVDKSFLLSLQIELKTRLDEAFHNIDSIKNPNNYNNEYKSYTDEPILTGINKNILLDYANKLVQTPTNFNLNKKLAKLFDNRIKELKLSNVDWATAEQLSFASILSENNSIRMTGQDVCRGTFSHRHSVLTDQESGKQYIPLNNLSSNQGQLLIKNSFLSEYAVLGFEYGYSIQNLQNLTIWEAQFGDFANGAQIILDQYVSSAESKWGIKSGLIIMLPHGYEGQGPEHSSARLERYLQLAGQKNIQIVIPTTPASYFHLFRKQIHADYRIPMIMITPKSLLRHKLVVSNISELDKGTSFNPVIIDKKNYNADTLILCSGKIYYDLYQYREDAGENSIAILRLEQLYPWPEKEIMDSIKKYDKVKKIIWCQEEPQNMGAWNFVLERFYNIDVNIEYIGRPSAASPAVGYLSIHNKEQKQILEKAIKG